MTHMHRWLVVLEDLGRHRVDIHLLVGGFIPFEKYNWGDCSQYMENQKMFQTTNQFVLPLQELKKKHDVAGYDFQCRQ